MRRRREADHGGEGGPEVEVRHHFVVLRTRRDVIRPPHQARNPKTGFKRRAFFAAERVGPASGHASCHAPLSVVNITIVSGASARIAAMTRPTLSSSSSIESE